MEKTILQFIQVPEISGNRFVIIIRKSNRVLQFKDNNEKDKYRNRRVETRWKRVRQILFIINIRK